MRRGPGHQEGLRPAWGGGTRRASANEPRAPGTATPVTHSQPAREDRHGVPRHPGGCRTPGRPRRQPQRGAEPRASHPERPQGQGGGWGRRRGAEGRGPRARPQLRGPRGPGPFAFAENGTGTAPSSHRQGRLQGDPDSRRETHHHSRVLACQGRGVRGLEAQANPWISTSEGPTLQRCTTPQHGPSQSPSERGSSGAGRADENQRTLGACGEAGPRGGPSTWPQVSARAADGRQAATPRPPTRTPRSANTPARQSLRAAGSALLLICTVQINYTL